MIDDSMDQGVCRGNRDMRCLEADGRSVGDEIDTSDVQGSFARPE